MPTRVRPRSAFIAGEQRLLGWRTCSRLHLIDDAEPVDLDAELTTGIE